MYFNWLDLTEDYEWGANRINKHGNGYFLGMYDCDGTPLYVGDQVEIYEDNSRKVINVAYCCCDVMLGLYFNNTAPWEENETVQNLDFEKFDEETQQMEEEYAELEEKMNQSSPEETQKLMDAFNARWELNPEVTPQENYTLKLTKDGLVCLNDAAKTQGIGRRLNLKVIKPYPERKKGEVEAMLQKVTDGYLSEVADRNHNHIYYGDTLKMRHKNGKEYEGKFLYSPFVVQYVDGWRLGDPFWTDDFFVDGEIVKPSPNRHEPTKEQILGFQE